LISAFWYRYQFVSFKNQHWISYWLFTKLLLPSG